MGTRTYSRRSANGIRVAVIQPNQKSNLSMLDDVSKGITDAFASQLRSRNVQVESVGNGFVIVRPRKLSPEEITQLLTLPTSDARFSYGYPTYRNVRYDVPTRGVVGAYMEQEGMTFEEALAKVESEIALYKQYVAEGERISPVLSSLKSQITSIVTPQEVNTQLEPLKTMVFRLAVRMARTPEIDARASVEREIRRLPEQFQNLPEAQINRIVQMTTEMAQSQRARQMFPYTTVIGYNDDTPYQAHKYALKFGKPDTYNIPYFEFALEYFRGA